MSVKVTKDINKPSINFKKFNHIIKRIKRIKMGIFDIKSKTIVTDYLGNDIVASFFITLFFFFDLIFIKIYRTVCQQK